MNRKIHDEICPLIIRIKRELEFYKGASENETLDQIIELSDRAYNDIRNLITREAITNPYTNWYEDIKLIIALYRKMKHFEINEFFEFEQHEIPAENRPTIGLYI